MKLNIVFFSTVLLIAHALSSSALAQQDNAAEPVAQEQEAQNADTFQPVSGLRKFDAENFPSVLFTYWKQVAIEDARRSRGLNRAPTDAELMRDLKKDKNENIPKPPPEARNISLSGIAYNGRESWTIWLNGQRVTPTAIPKEALDLKVFKEYIEIKWFDEYTNRIIPIRLRPHQRFNIDTRIFLPG